MTADSSNAALTVHLLTLVPGYFESPLKTSIVGKAIERGLVDIDVVDIRDFAEGKHRVCDDTPYGGGAGMVMKVDPVVRAMESLEPRDGHGRAWRVVLTPAGRPFTQAVAAELVAKRRIALVCGRYEGIDERAMAYVDDEISLGDFVMEGGESAALAVISTLMRLVPGVLGNAESVEDESFEAGLLEYPQYTRPAVFRGQGVPEILLSGDHGRIDLWRRGQSLLRTSRRRPELLAKQRLTDEDRRLLTDAETSEDSGDHA
jgi:tRNA (guanine37-N1)-methyltransferase